MANGLLRLCGNVIPLMTGIVGLVITLSQHALAAKNKGREVLRILAIKLHTCV